MSRKQVPTLVRLLYTHNPFYLISACLFIYGLKLLFRSGTSTVLFQRGSVAYMEPWGLMASFAGVTLLMAVTGVLVVHFGKVWEDARSLVLIVLLMLLAMAVSFDELINSLSDADNDRRHFYLMLGVGTGFALAISELMIRGLKLRLPFGYRLPLYSFLVLFFLWPALLLPELTGFTMEQTRWLIVAFPSVAAFVTMMLIPAVRKGADHVKDNGTPWNWPWLPWTPFVFIAVAVVGRSYTLTMSFDPLSSRSHYWDTIFGIYQLVPFALAICFVLLEIAVVEKLPLLQSKLLTVAPGLLLMAYPWNAPWRGLSGYSTYTYHVVDQLASPVFLTLFGLVAFYAWAWRKGIAVAELGIFAMLALLCWIGPDAFGHRIWTPRTQNAAFWPLAVMAVFQLCLAVQRKNSLRFLAGLFFAIVAQHTAAPQISAIGPWRGFITVHLCWLSLLMISVAFKGEFAAAMKEFAAPTLSLTTAIGLSLLNRDQQPLLVMPGYAAGMTLLAFMLWKFLRNVVYFYVAMLHCSLAAAGVVITGAVAFFRAPMPDGVRQVVLAVLSFLTAVLISATKSGLCRRIRLYRRTRERIL
jgi:hypothetical protein